MSSMTVHTFFTVDFFFFFKAPREMYLKQCLENERKKKGKKDMVKLQKESKGREGRLKSICCLELLKCFSSQMLFLSIHEGEERVLP